jgi:hypothetical protein
VTLDEFVALSERITGHRALDRTTAGAYLDALLRSPADRVVLADLVSHARTGAVTTPAHAAMEARILESWYTGEHPVGGTAQVAAYAGALMWTVLGRPAPGSCAGESGHWSRPPETKS